MGQVIRATGREGTQRGRDDELDAFSTWEAPHEATFPGPEFADLSEFRYFEFEEVRNPRISLKLESV